jgi:hypothetical protein
MPYFKLKVATVARTTFMVEADNIEDAANKWADSDLGLTQTEPWHVSVADKDFDLSDVEEVSDGEFFACGGGK